MELIDRVSDRANGQLVRGWMGIVLEFLGDGCFEIEFGDDSGRAHVLAALTPRQATRYFYRRQPLRSLEEISADILALGKETGGLPEEMVGGDKA